MHRMGNSLRWMIEKWFSLLPTEPLRVTRFSRARSNRRPCVCVEASRPSGALAIFFFRHDDGTWCVFPPESNRPAMNVTFVCSANEDLRDHLISGRIYE